MNRQMRRLQARVAANAARASMALTDWLALPRRERRRRRAVEYFCATCAVREGAPHLAWCHRPGVMRRQS